MKVELDKFNEKMRDLTDKMFQLSACNEASNYMRQAILETEFRTDRMLQSRYTLCDCIIEVLIAFHDAVAEAALFTSLNIAEYKAAFNAIYEQIDKSFESSIMHASPEFRKRIVQNYNELISDSRKRLTSTTMIVDEANLKKQQEEEDNE